MHRHWHFTFGILCKCLLLWLISHTEMCLSLRFKLCSFLRVCHWSLTFLLFQFLVVCKQCFLVVVFFLFFFCCFVLFFVFLTVAVTLTRAHFPVVPDKPETSYLNFSSHFYTASNRKPASSNLGQLQLLVCQIFGHLHTVVLPCMYLARGCHQWAVKRL